MRHSQSCNLRFSQILVAASLFSTTGVFAAPIPFQDAVASDNPALWYKFNELPGATSVINYGSLGSTFNANFPNGATLGAPTVGGDTGFRFSLAAQQYVESITAAPANFTGNPSFTAETIVFVEANAGGAGYPPFLHWGAPTTGRSVYFSLQRFCTDRMYAGFYNGGLRTTCSLFRSSSWHHIVWTRQGGGTQYQGTRLFIDGEEVALQPDTDLIGAPTINVTSTTFRVQRATDFTRYFTGTVDEVVLYPHVLTPEEVLEHYQALGSLAPIPCQADFNNDCAVDFFDYLDFVDAFSTNAPEADFNLDGTIDFFDYLDFVDVFSIGC